jgi:hypothetical protein
MIQKITNSIYPRIGDVIRTFEGDIGIIVATDYASLTPYCVEICNEFNEKSIWWFLEEHIYSL